MKTNSHQPLRRIVAVLATGLMLGGMVAGSVSAADMYRPGGLNEGGVPADPQTFNMTTTPTNKTYSWYGMRGWSTVYGSTNPGGPFTNPIISTKATEYAWSVTAANPDNSNNWYFVLGQTNHYASSAQCSSCHGFKYTAWTNTAHATAIKEILNPDGTFVDQYRNASCLPCHTAGYGKNTGFTDLTNTPALANVGCENCHGPAGWHRNSDHARIRPAVSIDPEICGGCHKDSHHPTYEEYETTLHAEVNLDIKYGSAAATNYFTNMVVWGGTNLYGYYLITNATNSSIVYTNPTTGIISSLNGPQTRTNLWTANLYDSGQDRAVGCGACHSAATRLALIKDYEARQSGTINPLTMPSAVDAASWTATCVTCHDPHSAANAAQLRHPMSSSKYYTMPTTADKRTNIVVNYNGSKTTNIAFYGTTFSTFYDPSIQICGQCHNSRGARWDGYSFALFTSNVVSSVTNTLYYDLYTTNVWTQAFTNNDTGATTNLTFTNVVVGGRGSYTTNYSQTNLAYRVGLTNSVSYSRAPHHAPQYNLLSGIVQPDYLNTNALGVATNVFGVHSLQPEGCAACHMTKKTVSYPSTNNPNYTGHEFEPLLTGFTGCAVSGCHSSVNDASNKMVSLQFEIATGITNLQTLLNTWATNKGPAIFTTNYTKYKENSWEYTSPGAYATVTNAGPGSTTLQLMIPTAIRQARFNLYMIGYGNAASLGVHNPTYTRYLLNDATNKVIQALAP